MYKTIVTKYCPKAEKMAELIENKVNEMENQGYELITFSYIPSTKATHVLKKVK